MLCSNNKQSDIGGLDLAIAQLEAEVIFLCITQWNILKTRWQG